MAKKPTARPWLDREHMTLEEACVWLEIENPALREWSKGALEEVHVDSRRMAQATSRHTSNGMAYRALNRAYAQIEIRMGW